MHKTTILLPDDLQRKAKRVAKNRGTTLSGLIRNQLEVAVRENKQAESNRALDPLFSEWKPVDAETPKDLAENHDKYLYDE